LNNKLGKKLTRGTVNGGSTTFENCHSNLEMHAQSVTCSKSGLNLHSDIYGLKYNTIFEPQKHLLGVVITEYFFTKESLKMSEHSLIVRLFITKILSLNLQSGKELNSLPVTLQNTEKYEIFTSS